MLVHRLPNWTGQASILLGRNRKDGSTTLQAPNSAIKISEGLWGALRKRVPTERVWVNIGEYIKQCLIVDVWDMI